MKGHIRKRGERSWAIIIDLDRGTDGKRKQKWHTVQGTKKEAERKLTELLHSLDTGMYVPPSKLTVGDFLGKWLQASAKSTVSGKTFERYSEIVNRRWIPAVGSIPLLKLTPLRIQACYSEWLSDGRLDGKKGGLSAQTVLHHHRVLREALNQAVRWQLMPRNPADAVDPPKPQRKEMKALDATQMAWLLAVARGTRFYVPVLLSMTTGMRRGEFLALRWSDVDLVSATVTVNRSIEQTNDGVKFKSTKGKRGRLVILPSIVVEVLNDHKVTQEAQKRLLGCGYTDLGLICAKEDGNIWKPDTMTSDFGDLTDRAGLTGVRLHDMRHSHATQLLLQGVNPKIVSERLGHSTVGITLDIYSHILPGMQEQAATKIDSALRTAIQKQQSSKPT
jgi:integrase